MDFGGGMATGMAAGMGSGIAIGISQGREAMKNEIRSSIEAGGYTIQDRYGKPVKLDDFMDETCGATCEKKNSKVAAVICGILAFAVLAGVAYFLFLN